MNEAHQWAATVAVRIGVFREARSMTQGELAKACGLARTSIVNIEAGRQAVTLPTLYLAAKALGVEPRKLLP